MRGWPARLRGVTETVTATLGPNERWNHAALGVRVEAPLDAGSEAAATATTWGNTRTRRNLEARGEAVVQFVADPREFVEAALDVRETPTDRPTLAAAAAHVRVDAERVYADEEAGTRQERWRLTPGEASVDCEGVPTVNRAFAAVVDATVAASRLDVDAYDEGDLLGRLAYDARVVEACGGPEERDAFDRVDELVGWRERSDRRNESF
jgi:hypothetical protein